MFDNKYQTLAFLNQIFAYSSRISLGNNSTKIFPVLTSYITGIGIIASSAVPATNLDTLRMITPSANTWLPSGEISGVDDLMSMLTLRFGFYVLFILLYCLL